MTKKETTLLETALQEIKSLKEIINNDVNMSEKYARCYDSLIGLYEVHTEHLEAFKMLLYMYKTEKEDLKIEVENLRKFEIFTILN